MKRIVVHTRWCPSDDAETDSASGEAPLTWAQLAAPLFDRASALGGRVVAWGHRFIAVDFAWDGLYDAIDYLVDAPLAPELASGMCHGDVIVIHEDARVAVGAGDTLFLAEQLAEVARPGEVLVSPAFVEASRGRVGTAGEAGKRPGRPAIAALVLDPAAPLLDVATSSVPVESKPSSYVAERADALLASSEWPEERASSRPISSADPAVGSRALESKDARSLLELAESMHSSESPEVAERLDAMAELARGQSGDALRRLRDARERAAQVGGAENCRAILSLAVGLYSMGRYQEAVFEALEALARTREIHDERGEDAATLLLGRLGRALSDSNSAAAWLGLSA